MINNLRGFNHLHGCQANEGWRAERLKHISTRDPYRFMLVGVDVPPDSDQDPQRRPDFDQDPLEFGMSVFTSGRIDTATFLVEEWQESRKASIARYLQSHAALVQPVHDYVERNPSSEITQTIATNVLQTPGAFPGYNRQTVLAKHCVYPNNTSALFVRRSKTEKPPHYPSWTAGSEIDLRDLLTAGAPELSEMNVASWALAAVYTLVTRKALVDEFAKKTQEADGHVEEPRQYHGKIAVDAERGNTLKDLLG
jgi:hypothetical protein